ncbi:unannotated protein [freshwater metagenome]|uniref:Unannotated protein n=1 Tax=freshwater metagenome TaxID=449393 RepID=A0A6J7C6F2_9ZZZZ
MDHYGEERRGVRVGRGVAQRLLGPPEKAHELVRGGIGIGAIAHNAQQAGERGRGRQGGEVGGVVLVAGFQVKVVRWARGKSGGCHVGAKSRRGEQADVGVVE